MQRSFLSFQRKVSVFLREEKTSQIFLPIDLRPMDRHLFLTVKIGKDHGVSAVVGEHLGVDTGNLLNTDKE